MLDSNASDSVASNRPSAFGTGDIQFTGIVVTFNEARRLRECLTSLKFCEQLIVTDLGSEDDSVQIAHECGAEVFQRNWVPVVELMRPEAVAKAHNEWIVILDPDEVLPAILVDRLIAALTSRPDVGVVCLPFQFYFRGRPLHTTVWGGIKHNPRVFHKSRVDLQTNVHRGIKAASGYTIETIQGDEHDAVRHYWIDSYRQMIEKHWRYIRREGESRYNNGERFSWRRCWIQTLKAGKYSLIDCHGMRGGFTGFFLSMFWAWYVFMSLLSLRRYQQTI